MYFLVPCLLRDSENEEFPEGGGDVCTQARLELFNDCKSRTRPGLVLQVSRGQSCNQKRRA